jgi:hypothetical protein
MHGEGPGERGEDCGVLRDVVQQLVCVLRVGFIGHVLGAASTVQPSCMLGQVRGVHQGFRVGVQQKSIYICSLLL